MLINYTLIAQSISFLLLVFLIIFFVRIIMFIIRKPKSDKELSMKLDRIIELLEEREKK